MNKRLTAVIQREDDGFVAFCPELDIASQGSKIQDARDQLREALELFFECALSSEIESRLGNDVFVTHIVVSIG
ncbi:MAG: type II toxin-antitoxin system HicB family antitoxin [Planctomycetota bacterium]